MGFKDIDFNPPATMAPPAVETYVDPAQKKVQLGVQQNEYLKGKADAKVMLADSIAEAKKTLAIAKSKTSDTSQEQADLVDYIKTLEGLKPVLAKLGDNAVEGFKGNLAALKSDLVLKVTGATGQSSTGKYYVEGVEADVQTYANAVAKESKVKLYNDAYTRLKAENPGWWEENLVRAAQDEATATFNRDNGIRANNGFTGAGGGNMTTTASGATLTTGGYSQEGTPVTGGQYDANGNYVGLNLTSGTSSTPAGTLAIDTFKSTLGLFVGKEEMNKPWVTQLYKSTSKFYKSGSTVEESFNMAIQDVQENPDMAEFTKRFKGIYDLTDKRRKGEAVYVPTVAEYFATEKTMGDSLRQSNLGELANEDFLGGIIGKAVSATEFANRIQYVFDKIDYAPAAVKKTMQQVMPYVDRASLAKALLTGEEGAKQLQAKVAGISVLAAAQQQGLGDTTLQSATDLANQGYSYQTALEGYQQVANIIPTAQKLTAIEGTGAYTQQQAENVVFGKSAAEELALSKLGAREQARYRGSSGNLGSKSLASSNRGY